jgi:integrative and conjugative element protein (TIGR02256 family)
MVRRPCTAARLSVVRIVNLRTIRVLGSAKALIRDTAMQSDWRTETGGALFGYDDGLQLTVAHATGPGPHAVHEERRFLRDLQYTQRAATRLSRETGAQWIGEWHTHPAGAGTPSERDVTTYVSHLVDPNLALCAFAALIVLPIRRRQAIEVHPWILVRIQGDVSLRAERPDEWSTQ